MWFCNKWPKFESSSKTTGGSRTAHCCRIWEIHVDNIWKEEQQRYMCTKFFGFMHRWAALRGLLGLCRCIQISLCGSKEPHQLTGVCLDTRLRLNTRDGRQYDERGVWRWFTAALTRTTTSGTGETAGHQRHENSVSNFSVNWTAGWQTKRLEVQTGIIDWIAGLACTLQ